MTVGVYYYILKDFEINQLRGVTCIVNVIFFRLCGGVLNWGVAKMAGETQEELNYQAVRDKLVARR